jgi:hypothetical protein
MTEDEIVPEDTKPIVSLIVSLVEIKMWYEFVSIQSIILVRKEPINFRYHRTSKFYENGVKISCRQQKTLKAPDIACVLDIKNRYFNINALQKSLSVHINYRGLIRKL